MAHSSAIVITTSDDITLAGIVLSPKSGVANAVIQFHAGTVVKKEFYLKFCASIADQGYEVVLVDFRGVGASRPAQLRGYQASISDWGKKDAPAILDWIKAAYPSLPIYLLAHSMGGQIIGLMSNWHVFEKITVLASSAGNWNKFEPQYRRKVRLASIYLYPIVLRMMGYVPGRLGTGYDWPRGVADEWRSNAMGDSLMSDYMSWKHGNTQYQQVDKQIHAIFFTDDYMATPDTVGDYAKTYPNAKVIVHELSHLQFNLPALKHKLIFKSSAQGPLWDYVLETLR